MNLISESSVGSTNRRVEALVGLDAFRDLAAERTIVSQLTSTLKTPREQLPERIAGLVAELKAAEKKIAAFESSRLSGRVPALLENAARDRRLPRRRSRTWASSAPSTSARRSCSTCARSSAPSRRSSLWRRGSTASRRSSIATNAAARDARAPRRERSPSRPPASSAAVAAARTTSRRAAAATSSAIGAALDGIRAVAEGLRCAPASGSASTSARPASASPAATGTACSRRRSRPSRAATARSTGIARADRGARADRDRRRSADLAERRRHGVDHRRPRASRRSSPPHPDCRSAWSTSASRRCRRSVPCTMPGDARRARVP